MRSRAGNRRTRVRFERQGSASAGYVSGDAPWSTLFECWADVNPMQSRDNGEQVIADRMVGVSAYEITVRYADEIGDVSPRDRMISVETGQTFNIRHVMDPDGRKRSIVITADTGKPRG